LEDGFVGRCDSFVVETDVHFPTDINLLRDAIRKTIETCVKLSEAQELSGWRQHAYHQRQFQKQYRRVQRLKVKSDKSHTTQAGRIKISHFGSAGCRSNRASTACMASLEREMPFL
jgi:hypothetical protein